MGRCTHFSSPSLAAFERIHREHSFGWAFENLDVFHTGRNSLDRAGLQAKLEGRKRGGWCYELNEWLSLALQDGGFQLRRLNARNIRISNHPRTHQVALVELEGRAWLADAGGSQILRAPMRLEDGFERIQDGLPFRVKRHPSAAQGPLAEPETWELQMRGDGGWKGLYQFTLETATAADLALGNHYHLTHPASKFSDTRIVTRPVPGGRLTLGDRILRTWRNTLDGEFLERQEEMETVVAYGDLLGNGFGLDLPGVAIDRLFTLEPSISRGNTPLQMGKA
jgi:N-hydroxyarylamine O-acetyltransferase